MSTYAEIRDTLKSGDLAFYSSHNGIGDKLIKWWTKSKYSHVGVIWVVAGRIFLLEASAFGGVRMVPLSLRLPDLVVSMNLDWNDAAETQAMSNMMKPYSFIDAIRAGLGEKYKENGWICTEYAASIVAKCGYKFPITAELPEQFVRLLNIEKKPFIFISK
jgi:hypothetical protein